MSWLKSSLDLVRHLRILKLRSRVSLTSSFSQETLIGTAASKILATEFFKDPSIRQQARDFMEACAVVSVEPTDKGQIIIDQFHLYSVLQFSPKTRKADP